MSTRSKSGCVTCRIRRVKCDEGKPQCQRCITARRTCDGYLTGPAAMPRRELAVAARNLGVIGPVSRALSRTPSRTPSAARRSVLSPHETIHFDLFRRVTLPTTMGIIPSEFWSRYILPLAHSETAVWHAAVAVGALHQQMEVLSKGTKHGILLTEQARLHYSQALSYEKSLDSPLKKVAFSILMITAANLGEKWSDSQTHLLNSMKTISEDAGQTPGLKDASLFLNRLDFQAMTFSESTAPYAFQQSGALRNVNEILLDVKPIITSYEELASELFGLFRAVMLLDDGLLTSHIPSGPYLTTYNAFIRRLIRWETQIAEFEASRPFHPDSFLTMASIRIYHATLRLMVTSSPLGQESRYDQYLGVFEYIIRLAATIIQPTKEAAAAAAVETEAASTAETGSPPRATRRPIILSLEPGIIVPLWIAVHRCRHQRLRHSGLDLLAQSSRVEGMWRSRPTSKALGAVVSVEEEDLPPREFEPYVPSPLTLAEISIPWASWKGPMFMPTFPSSLSWDPEAYVPEEKRATDIVGTTHFDNSMVRLSFVMSPAPHTSGPGPVRHVSVGDLGQV